MATTDGSVKIGFLKPGAGRGHYGEFAAMIPDGVTLDMQDLGVLRAALTDFAGRLESVVERASTLSRQLGWQGVMVPGAPVEVQNADLRQRLAAALDVPFTTALGAGVEALRAMEAKRVLMMTPFDPYMNRLIEAHMATTEFDVTLAELGFASEQEAVELDPGIVFDMTRRALGKAGPVDAIYFQGAVLNPLPIIDDMENEFQMPVISSNPAMFWSLLSKLSCRFPIPDKGRLVREWPALP
jgi:maleate cis-trans isomerase